MDTFPQYVTRGMPNDCFSTNFLGYINFHNDYDNRNHAIRSFLIWSSFFKSALANKRLDENGISDWLRECETYLNHDDYDSTAMKNYLMANKHLNSPLNILPTPKPIYSHAIRILNMQTAENISQINNNKVLEDFYNFLEKCLKEGYISVGKDVNHQIPMDIINGYEVLKNKLKFRSTTTAQAAVRSKVRSETYALPTVSTLMTLPPCPPFAERQYVWGQIMKYNKVIKKFYPPTDPPLGSLAAVVDLEFFYNKIMMDWSPEEHCKYKCEIATSQYNKAWSLIEQRIVNELDSRLSAKRSQANSDEAHMVNKIVETLAKSPMLNTPLQSLQTIVNSLADIVKQLTSLVTKMSQGQEASDVSNTQDAHFTTSSTQNDQNF